MPFTVFEIDASANSCPQGDVLDLGPGDGQAALAAAGLLDLYFMYSIPGAEAKTLVKADGRVLWDDNVGGRDAGRVQDEQGMEEKGRAPEIARDKLREILLGAVVANCIKWDKKVSRVEPVDGGKYDLQFADGTSASGFDFVVGADGA